MQVRRSEQLLSCKVPGGPVLAVLLVITGLEWIVWRAGPGACKVRQRVFNIAFPSIAVRAVEGVAGTRVLCLSYAPSSMGVVRGNEGRKAICRENEQ